MDYSPSRSEKRFQHRRRFTLAQTPVDLRRVVAGGLTKKARPMIDRAALRVRSGVVEPAQPGERNRPSAHHAGFKRYIEIAADEPFGAELGRGLADDDHFCVSGWIAEFAGAISGARNHGPFTNKHGADRRFAAEFGRPRFGESEAHRIVFVLSDQITRPVRPRRFGCSPSVFRGGPRRSGLGQAAARGNADATGRNKAV
jgi:hypothetical protein